jgi:hypothetical protein
VPSDAGAGPDGTASPSDSSVEREAISDGGIGDTNDVGITDIGDSGLGCNGPSDELGCPVDDGQAGSDAFHEDGAPGADADDTGGADDATRIDGEGGDVTRDSDAMIRDGNDALFDGADGRACSCALPDATGSVRHTDLSCLCQIVDCPQSYDMKLANELSLCRSFLGRVDVFTRVYQDCGLLGITRTALDADTPTWIFDAATRNFVGITYSPYDPYGRADPCRQDSPWYFPISAGTVPDSACSETVTNTFCWEAGTYAAPSAVDASGRPSH